MIPHEDDIVIFCSPQQLPRLDIVSLKSFFALTLQGPSTSPCVLLAELKQYKHRQVSQTR